MAADLAESQARLSAIIDNAVDGIITIDERGVILTANAACTRIFGYLPGEMIGNNVKMLMPEPYRGAHDEYLDRYYRTGEKRIIGTGRIVVGERRDGLTFPIELSVGEMRAGGERFFTGFLRDLTERQQAGLRSPLCRPGRVSPLEAVSYAFRQQLLAALEL